LVKILGGSPLNGAEAISLPEINENKYWTKFKLKTAGQIKVSRHIILHGFDRENIYSHIFKWR
jgi:hypothetical protein